MATRKIVRRRKNPPSALETDLGDIAKAAEKSIRIGIADTLKQALFFAGTRIHAELQGKGRSK